MHKLPAGVQGLVVPVSAWSCAGSDRVHHTM